MRYHHSGERLEDRRLMSVSKMVSALELDPVALPAVHPNTPVMPFATPTKKASFIDPTVTIENGNSVVISFQSYVAPYATLDGRNGGAIKIGDGSDVLDSARLVANPGHAVPGAPVAGRQQCVDRIRGEGPGPQHDRLVLGFGGAHGVGARAVIDDATIEPGAIVSPLARVGPGVTVPSGYRVLPGMDVTTDAEASNPKLGMVVPVTSSDLSALKLRSPTAWDWPRATPTSTRAARPRGPTPAATRRSAGVYNGYLPNVEGASLSPGPSYVGGTKKEGPEFLTPKQGLIGSLLYQLPRPRHRPGGSSPGNAPGRWPSTSAGPTRSAPMKASRSPSARSRTPACTSPSARRSGGTLTIGQDFRAGNDAVILGGPAAKAKIGDDVSIGAGAVVDHHLARLGLDRRRRRLPARLILPGQHRHPGRGDLRE